LNIVQRYVSIKLEVSMFFLFRENRTHGTDGLADGVERLMRPPIGGLHNNWNRPACSVAVVQYYHRPH